MSLALLAQATCTINGKPVSCDEAGEAVAGALAIGGVFFIVFMLFGLVNFIFFILSLIHLIKASDFKDRTLWIILILLVPFASWVYYLGVRKNYEKQKQGGAFQPTGQPASSPVAPVEPVAPAATTPVEPQAFVPSEPQVTATPEQPVSLEQPDSSDQQPPATPTV